MHILSGGPFSEARNRLALKKTEIQKNTFALPNEEGLEKYQMSNYDSARTKASFYIPWAFIQAIEVYVDKVNKIPRFSHAAPIWSL